MFHKTFKNSDSRTTFEIQNNISKLMFRVIYNGAADMATGQTDRPENLLRVTANEFRSICNGTITVTRHSSVLGAKNLIQNMPLADLAEICANNEGAIHIRKLALNHAGEWQYEATFTVELSNEGSIHADKSDFLKIDLDNFKPYVDTNTVSQDATYTINSLGSYVVRNEHLKYSPIACQANAVQSVDITGAYALALPWDTLKVNLTSNTGELQEILGEELDVIATDVNEVTYLIDGKSLGFLKWRVYPVALAHKANIMLASSMNAYALINKNYE